LRDFVDRLERDETTWYKKLKQTPARNDVTLDAEHLAGPVTGRKSSSSIPSAAKSAAQDIALDHAEARLDNVDKQVDNVDQTIQQ